MFLDPRSCVSACGEILTDGRILEAEFLEELGGEWLHAGLLAQELGWRYSSTGPGESVPEALKGTIGAVLKDLGVSQHMVVISPVSDDLFEVLDPGGAVLYLVDAAWVDRYVVAVVTSFG